MPQVDFYILDRDDPLCRLQFVCRLVTKILALKQQVDILVNDEASAAELDRLLWHYPPESFSPHQISPSEPQEAVRICLQAQVQDPQAVCINLRTQAPDNHAELQRLVEIVCQQADVLSTTREKYKFYRQQDYPLQSHSIPSSTL